MQMRVGYLDVRNDHVGNESHLCMYINMKAVVEFLNGAVEIQ